MGDHAFPWPWGKNQMPFTTQFRHPHILWARGEKGSTSGRVDGFTEVARSRDTGWVLDSHVGKDLRNSMGYVRPISNMYYVRS